MDTPDTYEIRVRDHLTTGWADWFDAMDLRYEANGEMVLVGQLPDQAALHGVLTKIRDLGLTLIAVNRIDLPKDDNTASPGDNHTS